MQNTRQLVNNLRPGGEVTLSKSAGVRVTAERSCDGREVRYVRHTSGGCEVIRTERF